MFKRVAALQVMVLCFAAGAIAAQGTVKAQRVQGQVETRFSAADSWEVLSPNAAVPTGAQVRTGADGMAVLLWDAGHVVRINALTTITINSDVAAGAEQIDLNLGQGEALANVKQLATGGEFKISTPSAVAGVRGTTFNVLLPPDGPAIVAVVDGDVAVSNLDLGIDMVVGAGFMIDAGSMTVEEIPEAQLSALQASAAEAAAAAEEEEAEEEEAEEEEAEEEAAEEEEEEAPEPEEPESEGIDDAVEQVIDSVKDSETSDAILRQTGTVIFDVQ